MFQDKYLKNGIKVFINKKIIGLSGKVVNVKIL